MVGTPEGREFIPRGFILMVGTPEGREFIPGNLGKN